MPNADDILDGLTKISASWKVLAVLWHVYFAFFGIMALSACRPSNRFVAALLVPPLASVGILGWLERNPFNGTAFCLLSLILLAVLFSSSTKPAHRAPVPWLLPGLILVVFGWSYPHFLDREPVSVYLYASPLGLIPCPSLSMVVGITLIYGGLHSRAWTLTLAAAALFYGVLGSLYLGVTIDWVLAGGGIAMFGLSFWCASGGVARAG